MSLGWQQRDADEAVRLVAGDIVAEGLDPQMSVRSCGAL